MGARFFGMCILGRVTLNLFLGIFLLSVGVSIPLEASSAPGRGVVEIGDDGCAVLLLPGLPTGTLKEKVGETTAMIASRLAQQPHSTHLKPEAGFSVPRRGESAPRLFAQFLGGQEFLWIPDSNAKSSVESMWDDATVDFMVKVKVPWGKKVFTPNALVARPIPTMEILRQNGPSSRYLIGKGYPAAFWRMHGGGTPSAVGANASTLARHFVKLGVPTIGIDQPNHGEGPDDPALWDLEKMVEYNLAAMDALIDPNVPILVEGHSWGGQFGVAMHLLSRNRAFKAKHRRILSRIKVIFADAPPADMSDGGSAELRAQREQAYYDRILAGDPTLLSQMSEGDLAFWAHHIRKGKISLRAEPATFASNVGYSFRAPELPYEEGVPLSVCYALFDGLCVTGRESHYDFFKRELPAGNTLVLGNHPTIKTLAQDKARTNGVLRGAPTTDRIGHQINDARSIGPNGEEVPIVFAWQQAQAERALGVKFFEITGGRADPLAEVYELFLLYGNNFAFRNLIKDHVEYVRQMRDRDEARRQDELKGLIGRLLDEYESTLVSRDQEVQRARETASKAHYMAARVVGGRAAAEKELKITVTAERRAELKVYLAAFERAIRDFEAGAARRIRESVGVTIEREVWIGQKRTEGGKEASSGMLDKWEKALALWDRQIDRSGFNYLIPDQIRTEDLRAVVRRLSILKPVEAQIRKIKSGTLQSAEGSEEKVKGLLRDLRLDSEQAIQEEQKRLMGLPQSVERLIEVSQLFASLEILNRSSDFIAELEGNVRDSQGDPARRAEFEAKIADKLAKMGQSGLNFRSVRDLRSNIASSLKEINEKLVLLQLPTVGSAVDLSSHVSRKLADAAKNFGIERYKIIETAINMIVAIEKDGINQEEKARAAHLASVKIPQPPGITRPQDAKWELEVYERQQDPVRWAQRREQLKAAMDGEEPVVRVAVSAVTQKYDETLRSLDEKLKDGLPPDIRSREAAAGRYLMLTQIANESYVPHGRRNSEIAALVQDIEQKRWIVRRASEGVARIEDQLATLNRQRDAILRSLDVIYEATKISGDKFTASELPPQVARIVIEREAALEAYQLAYTRLSKLQANYFEGLRRREQAQDGVRDESVYFQQPPEVEEARRLYVEARNHYLNLDKMTHRVFLRSLYQGEFASIATLPNVKRAQSQLKTLLGANLPLTVFDQDLRLSQLGTDSLEYQIAEVYQQLETQRGVIHQQQTKLNDSRSKYHQALATTAKENSLYDFIPVRMSEILNKDLTEVLAEIEARTPMGLAYREAITLTLRHWNRLWLEVQREKSLAQPEWYPISQKLLR